MGMKNPPNIFQSQWGRIDLSEYITICCLYFCRFLWILHDITSLPSGNQTWQWKIRIQMATYWVYPMFRHPYHIYFVGYISYILLYPHRICITSPSLVKHQTVDVFQSLHPNSPNSYAWWMLVIYPNSIKRRSPSIAIWPIEHTHRNINVGQKTQEIPLNNHHDDFHPSLPKDSTTSNAPTSSPRDGWRLRPVGLSRWRLQDRHGRLLF